MNNKKVIGIILAAGQGKRMETNTPKQFLNLGNKPLLYYSLKAFQESEVDEIVIVTGKDKMQYCKEEIVELYGFDKVSNIIEGGNERYESVYNALVQLKDCQYVLIHDGARPFVTVDLIHRMIDVVKKEQCCILGVPVKDTIKIVNEELDVKNTPNRANLWIVQTPQAFNYSILKEAYDIHMLKDNIQVTDDAMVIEEETTNKVKMVYGSYNNIKITTKEDLFVAEQILCNYL